MGRIGSNRESIERAKCLWLAGRTFLGLLIFSLALLQISLVGVIRPPPIAGNDHHHQHEVGGRRLQEFVDCTVVKRRESLPRDKSLEHDSNSGITKPCALLFFGLAKQFREVVLPSIRENILQVSDNARCDIYLHNYNITTTINPRTGEFDNVLHPEEVYDLTDNVITDTTEDFLAKRNMKYYADANMKPFRSLGWDRTALENMYKQWHSIERVWDFMQETEQRLGIEYDRVGLFRTDVKYVTPIDIFDGDAVIPEFGFLVNDRMFYGTYENAHIWAKIRFPSVPCYKPRHVSIKMHSEFFMNDLVLKNIPNVEKKDICFYRVRANVAVWEDDCSKEYAFPNHLVELNLTYT